MKHFPRLRALYPNKMLRAAEKGQVAYTSIVGLDTIEGKTDRLSDAEKSGAEPCSARVQVKNLLAPDRYERQDNGQVCCFSCVFVLNRSPSLRFDAIVSGAKLVR
jgi:hypothetical protein